MRFFFADSQDYIDPHFDFVNDAYNPDRLVQRDDVYAHEYFDRPPYDGMLVSRAIVGDEGAKGKYTTAQSMRFRRDGADKFLRYDPTRFGGELMGDCGAFSYANLPEPPYRVDEMVDYYSDCRFTLAVSIDHVIFGYDEAMDFDGLFGSNVPDVWRFRYDLTLRLANDFLERCSQVGASFRPIGVVQGWSPKSYAEGVRRLVEFGYDYIALGGMVPLKTRQIHNVLREVRDAAPHVNIHLFGFTKADEIEQFVPYRITSFDSTSPLLRAFKDGKRNYYSGERWYTAIRIPHADESRVFKEKILAGHKDQRHLRRMEASALAAVRGFAAHQVDLADAVDSVGAFALEFKPNDHPPLSAYAETLGERPWERCSCRVCREIGVEVVLFRGSNRNRRRGYHNLWTFHRKLQSLQGALAHAV